ncbi:right-handed parallel beta-helix repeat-containing protein [Flavobacterium sp.]|uniref:right-handed parallel beta-helix repeat-containing protein n=1 Tax=Flavobacterium sp. TaxID=239 RepID=UPI0038FC956D
MRYSILFILTLLISITSCRKDFDTIPSSGKLEFSKTTVYLDTVFTNIASSTYMLKVYNRSSDDITIPSIALAKGSASKYRLMVDGMTGLDGSDADAIGDGKIFPNVQLLAHDSLFVFIETTADIADANPADMLYTDEILFDAGALQQKVNLVTLIQDAVFLFPDRTPDGNGGFIYESLQIGSDPANRIYGFVLDDTELHFTNAKPYVIYGYAAVATGKNLIIDPGARVHFHDQSGIIVAGSIQVNGTVSPPAPPSPLPNLLPNEVIFEGDRLEPSFSETPGQWGTILLASGSTNNSFNHLTIKNASVGLFIQDNDATTVQIKNTQIYNSSNVGILARTAKINGENIVINNAGQYALACTLGGTYDFTHCTFADYWQGSSRQSPTVLLDNTFNDGTTIYVANLVQANFNNCIVYGPNNIEIGLNRSSNNAISFNHNIKNCLIKFNDTNNQFSGNPLYTSVFVPSNNNLMGSNATPFDPKFKNTSKNNLRIGLTSAAKGVGNPTYIIAQDADGITRTTPPDLGAYEHLNN